MKLKRWKSPDLGSYVDEKLAPQHNLCYNV